MPNASRCLRYPFLLPGKNSCEGKHFATTVAHAREWGTLLHGDNFAVIEVIVAEAHFHAFYLVGENVDNIGRAYFADLGQLQYCRVGRIHD
jgi:hypothetical protein